MFTIHRPHSGPNFKYEKPKSTQTESDKEPATAAKATDATGSMKLRSAPLGAAIALGSRKGLTTDTVELSTRSLILNALKTEDKGKSTQSTTNPFARTLQPATTGEPKPKLTFALKTKSQNAGFETTAENSKGISLPGVKPAQVTMWAEQNDDIGDLIDDSSPSQLTPEEEAEVARSPLPIRPGDPNAVKLSRNLQLIYSTADGKKLIDKVVQNGGSISTSTDWPNATGSQISVRDENMDVIVHELVHAATTQDGSSLVEEGVGSAIAVRTVNEIVANNPGIDVGLRYFGTDPTAAYFWGRDNNPAEASLPDSNNILTSLAEIGIFYEIPPGGPPIGGEDGRQVAA